MLETKENLTLVLGSSKRPILDVGMTQPFLPKVTTDGRDAINSFRHHHYQTRNPPQELSIWTPYFEEFLTNPLTHLNRWLRHFFEA